MKGILNFKNNIILMLLFIISNSFGQYELKAKFNTNITREIIKNDPNVLVVIHGGWTLVTFSFKFKGDTIKLQLEADSLKDGTTPLKLKVMYPKSYNAYKMYIVIKMQDDSEIPLFPEEFPRKSGAIEYYINIKEWSKLVDMRMKSIQYQKVNIKTKEVIVVQDDFENSPNSLFFFTFLHELFNIDSK